LQQSRWLIRSLESRNSTILNVAKAIVERQSAFMQYGEQAMKPLILRDIAEELEMHESTISRVTTNKYMYTPRGIFEFKYFFSSQLDTDTGSSCSSTAIRAMIKQLIAKEDARSPLSDSGLTQLLKDQGINVARRTVTKYREAMSIPSSHERKGLVTT
jgi:RNA polymerase sigma-54 factor